MRPQLLEYLARILFTCIQKCDIMNWLRHTSPLDVVSGSRDGSFALWDLTCKHRNESWMMLTELIPQLRERFVKGKAAFMAVTSVLYLKDELSIATAGAFDSTVKFWDTRNLRASATNASPHQEPTTDTTRFFF